MVKKGKGHAKDRCAWEILEIPDHLACVWCLSLFTFRSPCACTFFTPTDGHARPPARPPTVQENPRHVACAWSSPSTESFTSSPGHPDMRLRHPYSAEGLLLPKNFMRILNINPVASSSGRLLGSGDQLLGSDPFSAVLNAGPKP